MANIDNAFSVDKLSLEDQVLIIQGSDNPNDSPGYEAPKGSMYLRSSGSSYVKVGDADTAWEKVTSGNVATPSVYFFYNNASDIATYKLMSPVNSSGASQNVTLLNPPIGDSTIVTFATELNYPNKTFLPIGWFSVHIHADKVGGGGNDATLFAEIYKRNLAGTETLLCTTPNSNNLTNSISEYVLEFLNPSIITLLETDRIICKIRTTVTNGNPDVTVYFENAYFSRLSLPSEAGSGTVTSVSVTTANGVSGTVATATTTPAITISLGAITPTSVNSVVLSGTATPTLSVTGTSSISGSHSGTSSGTNTGNQSDATLTFSDITTNDSSSTQHGFLPKLSNVATQYLNGTGLWSVPSIVRSTYTNAATTQSITANTATTLAFTTGIRTDANITLSGNQFTFATGGWYTIMVNYSCSAASNSLSSQIWNLTLNGTNVSNSFYYTSSRNNGERINCSLISQVNIPNGGTLLVKFTGTNAVTTLATSGRITFIAG